MLTVPFKVLPGMAKAITSMLKTSRTVNNEKAQKVLGKEPIKLFKNKTGFTPLEFRLSFN